MLNHRFSRALRDILPAALVVVGAATATVTLATPAEAQAVHAVQQRVRTSAPSNSTLPEPIPSGRPAVRVIVDLERNTVAFADDEGGFAQAPGTLAAAERLPVSTVGSVESRFTNASQDLVRRLAAEPTRVFCAGPRASRWMPQYLESLRTDSQVPVFSAGQQVANGVVSGTAADPSAHGEPPVIITASGPEVQRDTSLVGNIARNTRGQIKNGAENTAYSVFSNITNGISDGVYRATNKVVGKVTGQSY